LAAALQGRAVGDIGGDGEGSAPGGVDAVGGGIDAFAAAGEQGDLGAELGESFGGGFSDTARGAGDDGDAAGERGSADDLAHDVRSSGR
jgi:hypothetical protein